MSGRFDTVGRHVLLDVWGVESEVLNDLPLMKKTVTAAARASGATVLRTVFRRFPVQGLSGVLVLAESHISVHTYPEHGYASFDVYTCGRTLDPLAACRHIILSLHPPRFFAREFLRGSLEGIKDLLSLGQAEDNLPQVLPSLYVPVG